MNGRLVTKYCVGVCVSEKERERERELESACVLMCLLYGDHYLLCGDDPYLFLDDLYQLLYRPMRQVAVPSQCVSI